MTSQTSSEFLLTMENIDNLDASSDIKLEESTNNEDKTISGNKRKLEVKSEANNLENTSDDLSTQPKRKKIRLDDSCAPKINTLSTTPQENDNNSNNNVYKVSPPQSNQHAPYFMPVAPPASQYFLPHHLAAHHLAPHPYISPHSLPFHHPHINMNINPSYIHPHHYNGYHGHTYRNQTINNHNLNNNNSNKNESIIKNNNNCSNKRKRNKKMKPEDDNENNNSELLGDDNDNKNNKLATDKSPFKTTYISPEEETELKNTNTALYSQFHHARQAIYQQYKNKIEQIRISNMLTQPKRKLQIKIAAIDAKVQEKKLFLSYLEMSKPQPNSWLISNSTHTINAFNRRKHNINNHKQQTPNAYSQPINNNNEQKENNNNNNNNNNNENNKCEEKKEISPNDAQPIKKPMSAKRVKKPKFSEYNVRVLRDWYETHTNNPYPSSSEKHLMCQLTGLTKYQVSRWFCNVRTRKPPPELSDNDEDIINIDKNNNNINNHPHININTTTHRQLNNEYYGHHQFHQIHNYHPHHHPIHLPPPPMTPIPLGTPINTGQNHHTHFNFTPMNINNINIPIINKQMQQQNENNMMDQNDNSEGLMPTINSNFYENNNNNNSSNNSDLMPPPLIDDHENSDNMNQS